MWQFYVKYLKDRPRIMKLLEKIPGPSALPLIGNALDFATDEVSTFVKFSGITLFQAEFTWQLQEMLLKYAVSNRGVMRLWVGPQPYVVLTTAAAAESLLKSRSLITKSEMYDILRPWVRNGMTVRCALIGRRPDGDWSRLAARARTGARVASSSRRRCTLTCSSTTCRPSPSRAAFSSSSLPGSPRAATSSIARPT